MRLAPMAFVVMALAPPVLAQDPSLSFAPTLPEAVGDVAGWEIVTGEFEATTSRGAYWFYVNPARPALYQLMRYRVELFTADASARRRGSAERVAFIRNPGSREPIACWERRAPGLTPDWRRIEAGTEEYALEMAVLMSVISVHRTVRASEVSP